MEVDRRTQLFDIVSSDTELSMIAFIYRVFGDIASDSPVSLQLVVFWPPAGCVLSTLSPLLCSGTETWILQTCSQHCPEFICENCLIEGCILGLFVFVTVVLIVSFSVSCQVCQQQLESVWTTCGGYVFSGWALLKAGGLTTHARASRRPPAGLRSTCIELCSYWTRFCTLCL